MWHVQGEERYAYRVLVRKTQERGHLEKLGSDGKIVLMFALKK
jgi:hypothetical protein